MGNKSSDWKDTTQYTASEPREPRAWTATCGPVRITVYKGSPYFEGKWVMQCPALGVRDEEIGLPDTAEAKTAQHIARNIIVRKLRDLAIDVGKLA